jgi:hypothetical protein
MFRLRPFELDPLQHKRKKHQITNCHGRGGGGGGGVSYKYIPVKWCRAVIRLPFGAQKLRFPGLNPHQRAQVMDLPVHELPEPKAPTGDFMIVVDEGEGL